MSNVVTSLLGGPSSTVMAPTVDQSGATGWLQDKDKQNALAEQQAQALAYRTATGQGPSLAGAQAQQQALEAMHNQNAMASSASGSGLAMARRQAMMSNAATMQGLGSTAATARAQEELGAQQNYGQMAAAARAGDIQSANTMAGLSTAQAQLQEQQNQANQQAAAANAQNTMGMISGIAGAAGGAMMADADLQEPGGPAHWTLREEPSFILAKNQRTGELRKVATEPLSDHEFQQAMAHHGAGPLGGDDPRRQHTTFSDLAMGAPANTNMVQRYPAMAPQNPGLYAARMQPQPIMAADLDMGPRPSMASMMTGMDGLKKKMAMLETARGKK